VFLTPVRRELPTRELGIIAPSSAACAYRLKLDGAVLGRLYRCHDAISVRKRVN
jgi:hypothetical protein